MGNSDIIVNSDIIINSDTIGNSDIAVNSDIIFIVLLLALCGFFDVGCHLTSVMSELREKMRWYCRLLERTLISSLPACMYDRQSWAETENIKAEHLNIT